MGLTEFVVDGTLNADGTLDLDRRPNLAAGRVTVIVRQEANPTAPIDHWWDAMQRARGELDRSGSSFMDDDEVCRHLEFLRERDEVDNRLVDENHR